MGSNDTPNQPDAHDPVDHPKVSIYLILPTHGDSSMSDDAKSRKDQDIHLWVSKEPKHVLIEEAITPSTGLEEPGVDVTIEQQHCQTTSQHW
jgi:hypothetical protein